MARTRSASFKQGSAETRAGEPPARRLRGFEAAGRLAQGAITDGARKRGATLARLLTHWGEIAGEDLGAITRPLRTTFGRDGLGATLTLATAPALAPMIQMRLPDLTARINAALGYGAVARIKLVQAGAEALNASMTSALAEAPAPFAHARFAPAQPVPPAAPPPGAELAAGVVDPAFRAALEMLARNLSTRSRNNGAQK